MPKTTKTSSTDDKMRAAGYMTPTELAKVLGIHIGSVYRWLDEHKAETLELLNKRYVKRDSVVKIVGPKAAMILGLVAAPVAPAKAG